MQGKKKKSKRWSMEDIKTIKKFMLTAKDTGMEEHVGLQAAATHFGVTLNSVTLRWRRWNKGEHSQTLKRKTTKIPMERKKREKRKYTKKQVVDAIIDDGGISKVKRKYTKRKLQTIQTSAVKEIDSFLQDQAMTRELRKRVIDLMDTSGHIKAVSVDLSNKSFTVIY